MFNKLITENAGRYSNYIIMPSNLVGTAEIIAKLPKEAVYLLDQTNESLAEYPAVYQDFSTDMKMGLKESSSSNMRSLTRSVMWVQMSMTLL